MLDKIYVVTRTSVYEVVAVGIGGKPTAKKIKLFGRSSVNIGASISGGNMVSINSMLVFYTSGTERGIDNCKSIEWNTSNVVALFKEEKAALDCSEEENLKTYDSRWLRETKEIFDEIGHDHPVFTTTDKIKPYFSI